jgi:hypothetical protein
MVAVVRARVADLAGAHWTDAELYAFLNAGFLELAHSLPDAALVGLTEATTGALVGAQNEYDLPSDFLRERLVLYKGKVAVRWMVRETGALISDSLIAGAISEANPFYRIWDNDVIFKVGTVTQAGAEVYEVRYIREPTTISSTVDPDLSSAYFNPVEDYAVALCLAEAGQAGAGAVQRAHFDEFCQLVTAQYSNPDFVYDGIPKDPLLGGQQ